MISRFRPRRAWLPRRLGRDARERERMERRYALTAAIRERSEAKLGEELTALLEGQADLIGGPRDPRR